MKPKRWAVVASKPIVDKHSCRLKLDRVRWPEDSEVDYYVSVRPDIVVLCALTTMRAAGLHVIKCRFEEALRSVRDRKIVSQSSVAG